MRLVKIGPPAKPRTKRKTAGSIIYEGPSRLDPSVEIVAIVGHGKTNQKTGPMRQLYILEKRDAPTETDRAGMCGNCALLKFCYVVRIHGSNQTWKAWKRGAYEKTTPAQAVRGHGLRFGADGDPAALPLRIVRELHREAAYHTGYTHHWRRFSGLRHYLMASVETIADRDKAHAAGWRTYRIGDYADLEAEIVCPFHSKGIQCDDCRQCDGQTGDKRKSIVNPPHGKHADQIRRTFDLD